MFTVQCCACIDSAYSQLVVYNSWRSDQTSKYWSSTATELVGPQSCAMEYTGRLRMLKYTAVGFPRDMHSVHLHRPGACEQQVQS